MTYVDFAVVVLVDVVLVGAVWALKQGRDEEDKESTEQSFRGLSGNVSIVCGQQKMINDKLSVLEFNHAMLEGQIQKKPDLSEDLAKIEERLAALEAKNPVHYQAMSDSFKALQGRITRVEKLMSTGKNPNYKGRPRGAKNKVAS